MRSGENGLLKLHWSPRSPFVRKVMIFAHETGLADSFERVRSVVAMRKPNAEGEIVCQKIPDFRIPFSSFLQAQAMAA